MGKDVMWALAKLDKLRDTHLHLAIELLNSGFKLREFDFFTFAVLNRSLSLFAAVSDLTKAKNYLAALPLIRLQIDNCLRFSAWGIVLDPHKLANDIVLGHLQIKDIKDASGKEMTDFQLRQRFRERYPNISLDYWYQLLSGYVHLSEVHFFEAVRIPDNISSTSEIEIRISL